MGSNRCTVGDWIGCPARREHQPDGFLCFDKISEIGLERNGIGENTAGRRRGEAMHRTLSSTVEQACSVHSFASYSPWVNR